MASPLSKEVQEFLSEPVFAHLSTLNSDGSPRGAMMWVETDGTYIIVNSPLPSTKVDNIKRDPRVFVNIQPTMEYPRRTFQFSGRVVSMVTEGANDHIDALAEKYVGEPRYPRRTPDMQRIKISIEPLEVNWPYSA